MANPSNTQASSETAGELDKVLNIIQEIIQKSTGGDYIYRGEPKEYPEVSSNLYRQYEAIGEEHFDIEAIQGRMLQEAQQYIDETDEFTIQTELQHYGGKTNLIDFTTDYLIALFFACDGHHDKDGRVILQDQEPIAKLIHQPKIPKHRVLAQRSIFVKPPKGHLPLNPEKIVRIPKALKEPLLEYLRKHHNISTPTVYNDLQGFIKIQDIHHDAYTAFYQGLTSSEQKNHDDAIKHYSKAIELNPNFAETYNNRGVAYADKKEHDRAIQDFNKALSLNPKDAETYSNRGIAYRHKGKYNRAIQDFDKAIALNPNYANAYNNRGVAYADKKDYDRAIQDFNKAIALNPNDAKAHTNRGLAYANRKDYDHAIQDYNKTIALNPNYANAYYNRGNAYLNKKDHNLAIKDFNKAIKLNPKDAEAYTNRGVAYHHKGKYNRAIDDYNQAIKRNPDYALVYYNRGETYLIQQAWNNAKTDLITAKEKGEDIVASFHEEYQNIPTFEKQHGVTLPPDLVALLS